MAGAFGALIRIIAYPFRRLARLFGSGPATTVEKSGAGFVAREAGKVGESLAHDPADEKRGDGAEQSFPFYRLARPTLIERTAADMTLEEARDYSAEAHKFYAYPFPLFTRSTLYYEQVEQDYIDHVLGRETQSTDANFLSIMDRFRQKLNANTARLFCVYTPALLALTIIAAIGGADLFGEAFAANFNVPGERLVIEVATLAVGLGLLTLLYQWPYKVTQQQNLLGLDNYITSKFSRINQNFQVAKRRAMNVERNMRMPQAAELKEEAGAWTIAYQWFAMRLLMCEMTVRNKLYQIRRNTTLYGVGGAFICVLLTIALGWGASALALAAPLDVAAIGAVFIAAAHLLIMPKASHETLSVLQPREWNRFHLIDLDETIRDHVGEDKLQIVTFRDRNRLE